MFVSISNLTRLAFVVNNKLPTYQLNGSNIENIILWIFIGIHAKHNYPRFFLSLSPLLWCGHSLNSILVTFSKIFDKWMSLLLSFWLTKKSLNKKSQFLRSEPHQKHSLLWWTRNGCNKVTQTATSYCFARDVQWMCLWWRYFVPRTLIL